MEALQRAIEDERKSRLINFPHHTGVGSLGCWGLPAGLPMPGVGLVAAIGTMFRHETPNIVDIRVPELSAECVQTIIQTHRGNAHRSSPGLRERELEWRRTHATELKQYENEWVVLEGEEVIAHGSDPMQVIRDAKNKSIQNLYIFFVEPETENLVRFGL